MQQHWMDGRILAGYFFWSRMARRGEKAALCLPMKSLPSLSCSIIARAHAQQPRTRAQTDEPMAGGHTFCSKCTIFHCTDVKPVQIHAFLCWLKSDSVMKPHGQSLSSPPHHNNNPLHLSVRLNRKRKSYEFLNVTPLQEIETLLGNVRLKR